MKPIQKHTMIAKAKTEPINRVPAILLYLMLSLLVTLAACNEPTGYEGPQGPQGEVGPVGPAGEDGSVMYAGAGTPADDIGKEGDYYLDTTTGEYYGPKDADGWGEPIIVLKGEDGADGQDGQDGADGEDGQDGSDGEDGSQIHAGAGAPAGSLGKAGDFYLDKANYDLYGPKTGDGWGAPINLQGPRGPAGPAGDDGSVIHAGTGAPSNDIGKNGDFYLNRNTGELYGPKTDNGWGEPIIILKGEDGQDGADGEDGQNGQDGSRIYAGNSAPDASLGKAGDFYLDKVNYDLYGPKTSDGWGMPVNLQGPRGPAGPAGEDGSVIHAGSGAPSNGIGKNGDFYLNKNTGELYGPKTADGWGTPISLQGPAGEDGEDGQDGQDGADGEDGSQIYAGTGAPDEALGVEGDYYLDKASYELYGPKTSNDWSTPLSLKGTANVLYSSWIDIDWNLQDDDAYKRMFISESRVTDELLDTGIIKMYIKQEGGDVEGSYRSAVALPMVSLNSSLYFFATTTTGEPPEENLPSGFTGLLIFNESVNGEDLVLPFEDNQIRYVLIPGGEPLKAKAGRLPVDLDDYQQVKRYFGIRD